tara:strand:- start:1464 stop:1796 length:333 start_codon:yes stop_codon:yes gene_type:complete
MKKILFLLATLLFIACSTEKEQMETVRTLAKEDLITQLQLPEGTKFNENDIVITEKASDLEEIGATYIVTATVVSQDASGAEVVTTHTLEYVKIGEGGLSPDDYELKSFD